MNQCDFVRKWVVDQNNNIFYAEPRSTDYKLNEFISGMCQLIYDILRSRGIEHTDIKIMRDRCIVINVHDLIIKFDNDWKHIDIARGTHRYSIFLDDCVESEINAAIESYDNIDYINSMILKGYHSINEIAELIRKSTLDIETNDPI